MAVSIFEKIKKEFPNYNEREGQKNMYEDCLSFIHSTNLSFIAEGPVGVGKTFAYLSAIVDSGIFPAVVSTNGLALQDQLMEKDLPFLASLSPFTFSALKGINNYVCLKNSNKNKDVLETTAPKMYKWIFQMNNKELPPEGILPEHWELVCTTSEDCDRRKCEFYNVCNYQLAKKNAMKSDIIVVNHSLLTASWNVGILPKPLITIIDECHEFYDYFRKFNSSFLSKNVVEKARSKCALLPSKAEICGEERYEIDAFFRYSMEEMDWDGLISDIEKCARFPQNELIEEKIDLNKYCVQIDRMINIICELKEDEVFKVLHSLESLHERCNNASADNVAKWLDNRNRLHLAPVDVSEEIGGYLNRNKTILTSATITVGNSFEFIKNRLGLSEIHTGVYESPFNYQKQAITIIPYNCNPKSHDYYDNAKIAIKAIIKNGHPKTLMLFTSFKDQNEFRYWFYDTFPGYSIFAQDGIVKKAYLTEKFKAAEGNAILIGQAASFGTGIDVIGNKNIILSKLNFDSIGDPLIKAENKFYESIGKNPFADLAIPKTGIRLKQQFGRGVRSIEDKVILAILDVRVFQWWARPILNSLPKTRLFNKV